MLTKNSIEVKTLQQLLENLVYDNNSFSGRNYTYIGDFELNGNPVTVYRHWSCDGNFFIYTDNTLTCAVAEITKDGEPFPYLDKNGKQVLKHGWIEIFDCNISIKRI
jgi:hypothetical protein